MKTLTILRLATALAFIATPTAVANDSLHLCELTCEVFPDGPPDASQCCRPAC